MFRRSLIPLLFSVATAFAAPDIEHPIERYDIILERLPFGAPPPTAGTGTEGMAIGSGAAGSPGSSDAAGNAQALPPEPPPVRLQAITRFGSIPAAGFVEIASGRSFLMRAGENVNGYTLIDVSPEVGAVVIARGTNEWCVSLSYANGQPTNIVASARAPYLTANAVPRKSAEKNQATVSEKPESEPTILENSVSGEDARAAEEAALVEQAMVVGPNGEKRLSYSKLNRLRTEAARKRAEALRAEAEAKERVRREEQMAAMARAEEEVAQKAEKEREDADARAEIVAAIAAGEDLGVEIELTAEEAASLSEAGFEVEE